MIENDGFTAVKAFLVLAANYAALSLGCLCAAISLSAVRNAGLYWCRLAKCAKYFFWINAALSVVVICIAAVENLSD